MSHKDMCIDYVQDRLYEDDDGQWYIDWDLDGENLDGPYNYNQAEEILWQNAVEAAHEQFIP